MSIPASGALHRLLAPLIDVGTFDFWVQQISPRAAWNRPLATVTARRLEARDTVTLTLALNRHCKLPQAGQHLNVSVEVDGRRTTRCYSPTRIDARHRTIEITVKHVPNGWVSTQLCHHTQAGDVIELGEPFGEMNGADAPGPWLMLAAGSGITPLISLIRQARERQASTPITLVYCAKKRADLCFLPELRQMVARQPGFALHVVLSQEPELIDGEMAGRLDGLILNAVIPDLAGYHVFACGPAGFVETARTAVGERARSFEAEAFTPPTLALNADEAVHPVHITLAQSGRTVTVSSQEALLPALEAHGLQIPHGCRMGVCHTCSCNKVSGTTRDLQNGQAQGEPQAAVRLCVSSASTDLILDL